MNYSYISGFFDADGSITMSKKSKDSKFRTLKIDFTNTYISPLLDIQEFVKSQGINSHISTKIKKKYNHNDSYSLSINSNQAVYKLCENLKSHHPKKQHRINTILKYHNNVTKRNGKYNSKEYQRKLAYERLFFFDNFL